jgi:hypothetical protein
VPPTSNRSDPGGAAKYSVTPVGRTAVCPAASCQRLDSERFRSAPRTCGALPGHAEPAVSWHSGFRGGAHARYKATPVHHAARRRDSGVAARGARAAAGRAAAACRRAHRFCGGRSGRARYLRRPAPILKHGAQIMHRDGAVQFCSFDIPTSSTLQALWPTPSTFEQCTSLIERPSCQRITAAAGDTQISRKRTGEGACGLASATTHMPPRATILPEL